MADFQISAAADVSESVCGFADKGLVPSLWVQGGLAGKRHLQYPPTPV